jgi:uncharacterized protein YfbU (UPF0304 family)
MGAAFIPSPDRIRPTWATSLRTSFRDFIRTLTFKPKEPFDMRIENHLLKRLDHWRKGEAGAPSRTEAAHQRLERGLAARKERTKPALSDGEKLIAFMLADVMTTLDPERGRVADLVQRAIAGGHYWALDQEMREIFHDRRDSLDDVRFVLDVLDMWDLLELSFEALSDEGRARLAEAVPHAGEVQFHGFHTIHEENYLRIAGVLIKDQGRFSRFHDRYPFLEMRRLTADTYRAMLERFGPIKGRLVGRPMTVEEMVRVLGG